jgi:PAS domain S-box-containing protein
VLFEPIDLQLVILLGWLAFGKVWRRYMLRNSKQVKNNNQPYENQFQDQHFDLAEIDETLRLAVEMAEIGIWEYTHADGRFMLSNLTRRILNYHEELTPDKILEIVWQADREYVREFLNQPPDPSSTKYSIDFRIEEAGKLRWVRIKGRPFFDEEGKRVRSVGVAFDITEIKEAELALRDSEERLNLATISTDTGTWEFFPKEDRHIWSDKTRELFGLLPGGKITFEYIRSIMLPEDHNLADAAFIKAFNPSGDGMFDAEYRIKRPTDQKIVWLKLKGKVFFGTDSLPERIVGVVFDISDRKAVELALQESEERLRLAVESTGLGTWEYLPDYGRFNWSARTKMLWGLPADAEISEDLYLSGIHPEDADQYLSAFKDAMRDKNGGMVDLQVRIRGINDGVVRWLRIIGQVYFDENDRPVRAIGVDFDISGQKKIEEELKASELKFRKIADANIIAIAFGDNNGLISDYNDAFLNLLGLTRKDFEARKISWREFILPEDLESYLEKRQERVRTDTTFEMRLKRSDGRIIYVIMGLSALDEEEKSAIAFFLDITDQKNYLESLRESEYRFRHLADAAPIVIWISRESGDALYVNKWWYEYTGLTVDENKGLEWEKVIHPEDLHLAADAYTNAVLNRTLYETEVRMRRHDGTYRWFLFRGIPRMEGSDFLKGYIGVGIDIHDRKEALDQLENNREELLRINKELVKRNNDLDNFIYTASHDLKAPVSNIEGLMQALLEVLREQDLLSGPADQIFKMMETSVEKFRGTITDLTEISHIQTDSLEGDVRKVKFADVMQEIRESSRELIISQNVDVCEDFQAAPEILFSGKNLRSILLNLVSNAIKYRDPSRRPIVKIETELEGNYTVIKVTDNGIGIAEANLNKIFGMFKRFHTHVEGSGIGLYIVKRIIENAEGKIEVTSQPGLGSQFRVYLPIRK